jgi:hypothetical protein
MIESRRGFLSLLGVGIITAPAIVRPASLMKVRSLLLPEPIDLMGEANTLLVEWGKELQRDEIQGLFREYARQILFMPETLKPRWANMMAEA